MNDHRIIRELIVTVRALREDLDQAQVDIDSINEQTAWQIETAKREAADIASNAEMGRSALASRVRTASYDLERAQRSGDSYRVDRATRPLRNLA